ncbi:hypothetical protein ACS0TY_002182 [Phlomoides rotata]
MHSPENPPSFFSLLIGNRRSFSPLQHNPRATLIGRESKLELSVYCTSARLATQYLDDKYERDYENHAASSSVANIDEWKLKLSMLLRSDKEQEIVSRDKRDRRDFKQISNLAKRMGLYCEIYGKVVVASKVPLPNYRPDMDDKQPQKERVIFEWPPPMYAK